MLRRGSDYRDNNIETKRDRHRLYNINHKKNERTNTENINILRISAQRVYILLNYIKNNKIVNL